MRTAHAHVAVIGGGPAGLSAAMTAARAGAQTVLLDENPTLGGQLRYRIAELDLDRPHRVRAYQLADELIHDATAAGVDARVGAIAWGLFDGNVLGVAGPDKPSELRADRLILATGSTDLPFAFAGGTLPGVFSSRAVQILLHLHRVLPGRRFAVIGDGPEAAEVAADIALAGGTVEVRMSSVDAADRLTALGPDGIQSLRLSGDHHDVDVIVVAVGRQPDCELGLMAGCTFGFDPALGGYVPVRDDRLCTTRPDILVAGDAAGVCDVAVAIAEGAYAGVSAAASLGFVDSAALGEAQRAYEQIVSSHARRVAALVPSHVQVEGGG